MLKNKQSPPSSRPAGLRRGEGGQVFLIVLMVTVIALTIGLSVASRNIVSLRTVREERDSQRALSAAEAGVERSLRTGTSTGLITLEGGSGATAVTYEATLNPLSIPIEGTELLVQGGSEVRKDEGADVWFVPHSDPNDPNSNAVFSSPWSGNITIFWGDALAACNNPALEIAIVSGTVSSPTLTRYVYDPCTSRANDNSFDAASGGGTVAGKTFSFSTSTLSVTNGFVVRVVPLYYSARNGVGVGANIALPRQGTLVESIGEAGGTRRKINVFRGFASLPVQYFLYGLFSP